MRRTSSGTAVIARPQPAQAAPTPERVLPVSLSARFYKQRLQDQLAVDDRGDAPAQPPTGRIASEDALLAVSDDAEFVRQAYLFFLKREPDLAGLHYFSQAVASAGRRAVADALRDSAEGRLARNPTPDPPPVDPADLPFELTQLLGIAGDEAFVAALYEETLRRPVDPAGLAHHLARLSRGVTRESLTQALAVSAEAQRIDRTFTWSGQPWPPPVSLAAERAQDFRILARGRPFELTDLLGIAGDEAFVSTLYEEALCRPVDPEGLAHHLALLSQGVSRDSMTQSVALSAEARRAGRPLTWNGHPWPPASRAHRVRRALWRLLGTESSSAGPQALREHQVNERLFHHLTATRKKLAHVERVVAGLPPIVDELRSELVTPTQLEAQRTHLESLVQKQGEMARSVASHTTDAVAGLQQAVDELRSQLATPAHLEPLQTCLQSLVQKQEETNRSVASLAGAMTEELQGIRVSQATLRAGTDELIAAATRAAAMPARTAVTAGDNVVASEVNGFIVGVPGEEWRLAAFHAFRGVLEPGLTRRFTESLASGMTVVDVGANVGIYTLIAARAVAPAGKVYSFEPTPRTFAILTDNIQVNGLLESGLIDRRQAAVSDRRGTARLAVYRDNNGHNTLFAGGTGPEFVDVETVSLDDALAGVTRVDLIKIDAEGAEALIWNGMSRTLRQNPAVKVFMEFAPSLLHRAGQDPGAFLDRLAASGFRIQRVDDQTGALTDDTRESLCGVFSANLMLTRAGA